MSEPPLPPHLAKASCEFKGVIRERKPHKSAKKRNRDKKATEAAKKSTEDDGVKKVDDETVKIVAKDEVKKLDDEATKNDKETKKLHEKDCVSVGDKPSIDSTELTARADGVETVHGLSDQPSQANNPPAPDSTTADLPDSAAPPLSNTAGIDAEVTKKKRRKRRKKRTTPSEDGLGLDEDSPASPTPDSSPTLDLLPSFPREEDEKKKKKKTTKEEPKVDGGKSGPPWGKDARGDAMAGETLGAEEKTTRPIFTSSTVSLELGPDTVTSVCLVASSSLGATVARSRDGGEAEEEEKQEEEKQEEEEEGGSRKRLHACGFCGAEETSAKSFKRCQK